MEARTHKSVILQNDGKPFVFGIVRDVTELAVAQEVLRKELDTANALVSRKSMFLASLGHEIRNPLQAMLEAARQLEEHVAPGTASELAHLLRRSGRDLLELVDDILDLSHLESGHADLRRIPFDLPNLVEEAASLFDPMVRARGGSLSIVCGKHPLIVQGDPIRLRQILSNLLGNAVRYAGHTAIRVELSVEGKEASRIVPFTVRVVDQGPGFTAEEGMRLFERWRRGSANQKGTGLGLAIVHQTVEAMGGTILAEGHPGAGASFTIHLKLPRAGHQLDLFNAWTATASELENLRIDTPSESLLHRPPPVPTVPASHSISSQASPSDQDTPPDGLRILVVEDNHTNQFVLRQLLHKLHHHTALAENGAEALEHLETESFDIVLMDCQMPVMDGFEATRRWRARETERGLVRIPILAVTALNLLTTRDECISSGMDDVLTKPLRITTIQDALKHWTPTRVS